MEYLWLWITLGAIAAAFLVALFVLFNNDCLKITRYKIAIDGAPKGIKIVHLSDLHGKKFGRGNSRLIAKVASESPDFIAFTGDVIHLYTRKNRETALGLAASLKEVAPFIYVSGNHELRNKGYRFFRKELMEAGALVLDDSSLTVCGMSVTGMKASSLKNDKIYKITPDSGVKILLAHEPQYFDKYSECGYDLVLCGHAHGGQWRIPFTKIGLFAPGQGIFPKYTAGMHCRGKTKMIISRGLGNSEFPLRLFNRPEIVVIEIN